MRSLQWPTSKVSIYIMATNMRSLQWLTTRVPLLTSVSAASVSRLSPYRVYKNSMHAHEQCVYITIYQPCMRLDRQRERTLDRHAQQCPDTLTFTTNDRVKGKNVTMDSSVESSRGKHYVPVCSQTSQWGELPTVIEESSLRSVRRAPYSQWGELTTCLWG